MLLGNKAEIFSAPAMDLVQNGKEKGINAPTQITPWHGAAENQGKPHLFFRKDGQILKGKAKRDR